MQRRLSRLRVADVTVQVEVARGPAAGNQVRSTDFDDWARTAGPRLLRFAYAVTGNPHDAADAVQEALVAVFPRWQRLSADGGADAYARRAIVNRRISWWRSIGRREVVGLTSVPESALPAGPDPAAADAGIALEVLWTLPARQRAAVALRYLDDLTFAEVARILDCPESTARSHVHRALARLRTELGDDHE